jgi:hypothetical protein
LLAGFLRMFVGLAAGWLALHLTGSLTALFVALGLGMFLYGILVTAAVALGSWFRGAPAASSA